MEKKNDNKDVVDKFLYSRLNEIEQEILDAHPILKYRVNHFAEGVNVRGMIETDSPKCAILLDDSVIAGDFHFPCVIYMREKGEPVGNVGPDMRAERKKWFENHNCLEDEICRKNCLDVCIHHNNQYREFHKKNINEKV